MAAASAQSLSAQLQRIDLDDVDEVLKTANEALKRSKRDTEALRVKLYALIKLDRYDDALRLLEEDGDAIKTAAPLEWAYALYKEGRYEEARKVTDASGQSPGLLHLRAQLAYRLEDFAQAADIYEQLTKQGEGDEIDLRTNTVATDAQLGWAGQAHLMRRGQADRFDREQFLTSFNAACACIARGELKQAELLLGSARDLCNATDELSESEKAAELLPMTVQLIYVLCCLGRMDDAAQLSTEVDVSSVPDLATRQIALVNSLHSKGGDANPYLSHRLFHSIPPIPPNQKPFQFQLRKLNWNGKVMDLQSGKTGSIKGPAQRHQSSDEDIIETAQRSVLGAAAQAKNQTGKAAIRQLLPLLERRPADIGLILTIVHLYVMTNNIPTATSLLESFLKRLELSTDAKDQDVRFAPGLVATLVSLYAAQHRSEHTKAELAKTATFWRHKSKASPAARLLLRHAGAVLADAAVADDDGDVALAREIFKDLADHAPANDIVSVAGVAASADKQTLSSIRPQDLLQKLPDVAKLTAGIDAAALEDSGIPYATTTVASSAKNASKKRPAPHAGASSEAPARKPKKIRNSKMPKDYDANKKVDPERWLPMKDRSYYRPKKKKGKGAAAQGMATQGGAVGGGEEGRPGTPAGKVMQGSVKNKKKKGKR